MKNCCVKTVKVEKDKLVKKKLFIGNILNCKVGFHSLIKYVSLIFFTIHIKWSLG